jgi:D-alanyl-lipoteichoic acid acyltransferase DltB (MBOAT superfamily)
VLFNSYVFVFCFLPLALIVFHTIGRSGRRRLAIAWLVTASLFFYGWWNPRFLALIAGSMLFNFGMGRVLSDERWRRTWVLAVGVAANLGLIAYFKYANFLANNFDRFVETSFELAPIVLPLAISFFTFQQIAYLVDARRGKTSEHDFLDYCLFVTFFPQLIAGPIVHHREMLPQFGRASVYRFRYDKLSVGVTLFVIGLFKKVVIADGIALYADPVFDAAAQGLALSHLEAWGGAIAYSFQIYYDFSGYSDMAIGLAAMFGVRLPLNFNSPYKATSIIDFWRRWHMTLSRFLRDYVYISLGGNRKGEARRLSNLMITMLLGGLWHGAGWRFVIWGGLHGLYLIINHVWRRLVPRAPDATPSRWGAGVGRTLTFSGVVIAWVFFRADNFQAAVNMLHAMFALDGFALPPTPVWETGALASWLQQAGVEVRELPHFAGGAELVALAALWLHVTWAPNSQQLLAEHRPALETYPGEVEPLRWPQLAWRPAPRFALATATLAALSLVFFVRESEFLYFQF